MEEITVRQATKKDIPFLAKIILMAETSGHELVSYKKMFPISDSELLSGFEATLDNEQFGHGLTYETFLIAELDGKPGAAACGYIEGEHGSSNHLMTGALMTGFPTELIIAGYKKNAEFKEIQINKTPGTLQIDSVATLPEFRGKGLFKLIFEEHCKAAEAEGCNQVEIQVWSGNQGAISTYKKLGCEIASEKYVDINNQNLGGKVLMTRKIKD